MYLPTQILYQDNKLIPYNPAQKKTHRLPNPNIKTMSSSVRFPFSSINRSGRKASGSGYLVSSRVIALRDGNC